MIKVSIHNLVPEGLPINGTHSPAFLDFKDDMTSIHDDISYDLVGSLVSNGALIKGSVSVTVQTICSSCLCDCEKVLEGDVCHFYESSLPSELDITDDIREDILITIPQNIHCSDACKGLCHVCGADLNKTTCNCSDEGSKGGVWSELDKLQC